MDTLIVRGGTLGTSNKFYTPGVHEIEDAGELADLELTARDLPWVTIERDYVEPLQLVERTSPENPQPAIPSPGQNLIADTGNSHFEPTAAAKIEEALIPEAERPAPGFPCPYCESNLRNEGARISHVKAKHVEQADDFMAQRRAAREAGEHGWGENAPSEE